MSKVMLTLGSFIVGACSMFLVLSGIHTSTWVHASEGPAVPVVPPLPGNTSFNNLWDATVDLDGLESEGDTFKDPTIVYGGGRFKIIRPTFSGSIRLTLKGAAANTLVLLQFLQAVEAGRKPNPGVPQIPPQRVITVKQPITADLISP